jgi:phosphoglycerate dehydrogenase-like enzyme
VIVTATRGIHGEPVAELAFLTMLAFARDFRRIEHPRGDQKWQRYPGTLTTEPLPPDNPLWSMLNVIITLHIGGYYDNYPRDAAIQFEQSLALFAAGKPVLMLNREKRG